MVGTLKVLGYIHTYMHKYIHSIHKENIFINETNLYLPIGNWNFQNGCHLWQKESLNREELQKLLELTRERRGSCIMIQKRWDSTKSTYLSRGDG